MANTGDLIREAIRNGEDYLKSQIQIALAADQRAVSLGGILAAGASVVLGFVFTDAGRLTEAGSYLCLLLSGGMGISAGLAFYSARPVEFRTIGNLPSHWYEDIENAKDLSEALSEEMEHIDKAILENGIIINRNAEFLKWAMLAAATSVVIAAVSGLALALF